MPDFRIPYFLLDTAAKIKIFNEAIPPNIFLIPYYKKRPSGYDD